MIGHEHQIQKTSLFNKAMSQSDFFHCFSRSPVMTSQCSNSVISNVFASNITDFQLFVVSLHQDWLRLGIWSKFHCFWGAQSLLDVEKQCNYVQYVYL